METIVFPDVEDLLQQYLTVQLPLAGFDVPVHVKIPDPRPDSFVTIPRVGGVRRNMVVDTATISVDCWGMTPQPALQLAQVTRGLIHGLIDQQLGDYPVYRVDEFAGPGNNPDPVSYHSRYTATYSVFIRGRAI